MKLYNSRRQTSSKNQRWSQGHNARGLGQELKKIRDQGQGPTFRGQTLSRPRTGMVEAIDREHNFCKLWSVNFP